LLNSHDQEILLDSLFKIQKQSTLEEAEEPKPDPKEGTMMVLKLTEGHGVIEEGIQALLDNDWTNRKQPLDKEV
jgi:hypothetical protein